MPTLRLGTARIDQVPEHQLPVPLALLTDDEELIARRVAGLPAGFCDPQTRTFQFSNHSWVLRVDGVTVLVDPCTGNGRKGLGPYFDDLDTPYLQRLSDAGAPAHDIDIVFCTHLHHDHCGWNTTYEDGRWVPTFPNATYLIGADEYRRWDTADPVRHPNDFNPSVFDDCVRPVVEAGLSRIVSIPHQITDSLVVDEAFGHTVGHCMLRLSSGHERAYFTGDVFHHPIQMTRPEAHLPGCDDLATAIATRKGLVQRALEESAFILPAHFPAPHHGRLSTDGNEVCFLPGGLPQAEP
jgi:glyoxylase-like metal-dependent hydrolase (beta-lactamase superfamily II)